MKKTIAIAAVLFAGIVSNANAVPIKIEFTGTVFSSNRFDINGLATPEPSYMGQTIVGGFLIETEGLQRVTASNNSFSSLSFNDVPAAPELVTSWLTIGGTAFDIGMYDVDTGGIRYQDSRGTVSCGPSCTSTSPDQFTFTDASAQVIVTPFPFPSPGTYFGRQLTLTSAMPFDPANPSTVTQYFDITEDFDALTVLDLPMSPSVHRLGGGFSELTTVCVQLSCRTWSSLAVGYNVSSVSVRIASVPEPSALSLIAIVLLTLGVSGRRVATRN